MSMISVLMTAYNCEKYIAQAIDSILQQTFTDFEFIILNDGSTDTTLDVIQTYKDNRIRLINDGKLGYYAAKRRLIHEAKGDYIAIMDGDDICNKDRLEVEYNFLNANEDYGLVGTNAAWINTDGKQFGKGFNFNFSPDELKCRLLFLNCFVHTSVLMRKSVLDNYQLNYKEIAGEDFDLWIQIAKHAKVKNIAKPMIQYRIHSNNMVHSNWYKLNDGLKQIIFEQLDFYFPNQFTTEEKEAYFGLVNFEEKADVSSLESIITMISKMLQTNKKNKHFDDFSLRKVIQERWFKKIIRLTSYSSETLTLHKKMKNILNISTTPKQSIFELILRVNMLFKKQIIKLN
jgi:glycosyltransferase involved in cell wall biosynthesis